MRSSLLLLLLPSLALAVSSGHHSVHEIGASYTVDPIGPAISYSISQTEVDFDNDPIFQLDAAISEAADIYVEGRMWCAAPWTEDYLVDQGPYVSDIFGWELIDELDGVTDTSFEVEWTGFSDSVNDYHMIGDLSYQFRMMFEVDGVLSKWYKTAVGVVADPVEDTTAPTVNVDNVFYDFISVEIEVFPHLRGKFELAGLVATDDMFEDTMVRVGFNYGGQWHNTSFAFNSGSAMAYTVNYTDMDSLIAADGTSFGCRYEAIDGVGNRTGWVDLPDGDLSGHECDWDETIGIVRNMSVSGVCSGGAVAVVNAHFSTAPCYMVAQIRVRSGTGDWVESSPTSNATYHFLQGVVAPCDDIEMEYRLTMDETTTDWESYGSVTCE